MHPAAKAVRVRKSPARRAVLHVERLESRLTPYSLSGNSWLQPQLVSLSFVPDGTNLGGAYSNLFATMNAKWTTATWQKEILRAAQVWAQQTNLNFTLVADDGSASGSGSYQQGAANFGDVRIGALSMGYGGPLGSAIYPQPACNYSLGGDYNLNSAENWVINQAGGFDLFTVSAHEVGHALGLGHPTGMGTTPVMYGMYTSIKPNLRTDDINGIRAQYSSSSARAADSYDAAASNGTFATATDITGALSGLTGVVSDRDITTVADVDYYKVTAPAGSGSTLTVKMQSSGLSLLSPLLKVYDANQVQIGSASGLNQYGATLTVTINGVSAGQQFYIMADGADTTAFGTGKYAVTLNFGGSDPTVTLPNTQTANGSPIQCGGGIGSSRKHDHDHDHHDGASTQVGTGAASALVQLVTVSPVKQAAAPQQERPGVTQPPAPAVDAVFAAPGREAMAEAVTESADAEPQELDAVFAELFV